MPEPTYNTDIEFRNIGNLNPHDDIYNEHDITMLYAEFVDIPETYAKRMRALIKNAINDKAEFTLIDHYGTPTWLENGYNTELAKLMTQYQKWSDTPADLSLEFSTNQNETGIIDHAPRFKHITSTDLPD